MGDGVLTTIWEDVWLEDSPFKIQFPRVYALELDKLANVKSRLDLGYWDVCLRRAPRGGVEAAQFYELQQILSTFVSSCQKDRWVWFRVII